MSETTINERGNAIERFDCGEYPKRADDRYAFDFEHCKGADGWRQYDTDQDAWYFGAWVHVVRREILTYAEGDVSVVRCPTVDGLRAELVAMAAFYGPPPPAFVVFDADGTRTELYDARPAGT